MASKKRISLSLDVDILNKVNRLAKEVRLQEINDGLSPSSLSSIVNELLGLAVQERSGEPCYV
jgi:hypothetical protein